MESADVTSLVYSGIVCLCRDFVTFDVVITSSPLNF